MLDDFVDLLGRKQPSVPALVTRLTTTPPTRALPARTGRRRGRILRRRQRRVPRTPIQPPLELSHPSLESLVRLDQLTHPQQQRHSRLTITIKNRLGFSPLHNSRFATRAEVPLPGERLPELSDLQVVSCLRRPSDGLEPSTPSLPWRFPGVTRVHARSFATQFLLQIGASNASGMRREASRVSFLMCPFCVRASSSDLATHLRRSKTSRRGLRRRGLRPRMRYRFRGLRGFGARRAQQARVAVCARPPEGLASADPRRRGAICKPASPA